MAEAEIKVCMGSACFAKGNREILDQIRHYIKENSLEERISVVGFLCQNKCASGPRIIVNGTEHTNCSLDGLKPILDNLASGLEK